MAMYAVTVVQYTERGQGKRYLLLPSIVATKTSKPLSEPPLVCDPEPYQHLSHQVTISCSHMNLALDDRVGLLNVFHPILHRRLLLLLVARDQLAVRLC